MPPPLSTHPEVIPHIMFAANILNGHEAVKP